MCFQSEQIKDIHDKGTGQGKYHPDYDKYPTPSWKMEPGEKQKPDAADRQNKNRTSLSTNDSARG